MKRIARLQSRSSVPVIKPFLQARKFATSSEHGDSAPEPQTQARSEAPGLDKPGQDDFIFDDLFEVNVDDKTVKTAVGPLPISPLMDPTWREARTRGNVKALPDKSKLNRFQRQLYQNPFAQMLATHVRSCYVTRTRLPVAFLQNFGLVRHPETNDVWWIPDSITQSENPSPEKSAEAEGSQLVSTSDETSGSSEVAAIEAVPAASEASEDKTVKLKSNYRYSSHVLGRRDLLQGFFMNGNKYRGGQFRLASSPNVSGLAKSAIWREDMDTAILDLRRRQIMHDLLYLSRLCEQKERKYLVKVNDATETGHHVRRWSFLWLGESKEHPSEGVAQDSAAGPDKLEYGPGQYAALDIDGVPTTTRPVYNLPRLLGPDNIQRLRSESSILREGSLFLLRGQRSSNLNLRLWTLQGYIADYSKLK